VKEEAQSPHSQKDARKHHLSFASKATVFVLKSPLQGSKHAETLVKLSKLQ
jgi:hypothetical protein